MALCKNVVNHMIKNDEFSKWLEIRVIRVGEGYAKTTMKVRREMINGLGVAHGGIAFSFADSTFAFACNNRNNLSLALDTSINFLKPIVAGDVLTAETKEIHNGKSTGLYHVIVRNQRDETVAIFKGTCFRTGKPVIAEP